ncbi:TrkA-N domain dehydrogenase [Thozetella sp. PMI_491]|nr:TrkA-N domain dehydrogenase [Thozetella sp. PMI_491]
MRIFIIGGSGRAGSLIVDDAIARGHTVVALVRKATSLAERPGLSTVVGEPLSKADVDAALASATASGPVDAVVFALNARRVADSPFAAVSPDSPPGMLTDAGNNALAAMKKHGVRKLVVLSTVGTGNSWKSMNFLFRGLFSHSNMRFQVDDHNNLDAAVRKAAADGSINFVMARSCMMTDGEEAEVKVHPDDGAGLGFLPKISRKSVARFLVRAVESEEWNGTTPIICN